MAKNSKERKLDSKLIEVYNKHGLKTFVNVCSEMLKIRDKENWEKKMKVNGEVCEVVLRVLTEHYLAARNITGHVFHSLVLGNPNKPESEFRTELDFTLLTPSVCLTGECKSFVGHITATDECTLRREKLIADVYRQLAVHVSALVPYLQQYVRRGAGIVDVPVLPFCFLYSNGALEDRRTRTAQAELPIHTIQSLFKYYDLVFSRYRREVYNVKEAAKAFQAMADSRILHIQHAHYLGY